ncbi:MAG: hypothetical protein IT257_10990, partial [Chitinophagaceae bacterium]|nr:hypothetical protein [Chitinophagaceae bacterium]
LQILWDGDDIGAKEFGSQDLVVKALGDYNIVKSKVTDEDEQHLELEFSEPLLANQNLNGIITVTETDNLSFAIEGNLLKIFLKDRIIGTRTLKVGTGIKNCKGYKMKTAYSEDLEFFAAKPSLRLVGNGCILPNSQGLIFPFETVNLKSVDVRIIKIFENNIHQFLQVNELNGSDGLMRVGKIVAEKKLNLNYSKKDLSQWNEHVIDLSKMISPDPGSIYRVSIKFDKEDALFACDSSLDNDHEINEEAVIQDEAISETDKEWDEDHWNDNSFDDYETWEDYGDNYTPCENSYYHGKAVSRNILASDIGLLFKLDENKMSHSFVSNMITTEPMPNTKIEFFDYTKQLIAGGTTDKDGKLDLFLSQKPFLMVAKNGKQRGYMKLLDANANSLSKFNIEGDIVKKGIKGFLYAERGVWRPGDSMYIQFILEDKQHQLPDNHPVSFELFDPQGKSVYQTTTSHHTNHTYDFRTSTQQQSPTGNYVAIAKVGNHEFSKSFHVETVKPNRLKINLDLPKVIYENGPNNTIPLQAKWLHGADAKNLTATVYSTLSNTETKFDQYPDYVFASPLKTFTSNEIVVFAGQLNENGQADIPCSLKIGNNAPGMLKANFVTKVFEEGGDFSIDKNTVLYSPFNRYIGIKVPPSDQYNSCLEVNKNYTFNIASVTNKGLPDNGGKLHLKIYRIEWRWWYETNEDDASAYLSKTSTLVVKDTILKTSQGKTSFTFKSDRENYARYMMIVTDEEGGHETGKIISFDNPYWSGANNNNTAENATMLNFSCDKEKYNKGDQVKMTIPSASNGNALISIETGNKVLQTYWTNTSKGETKFEFTATEQMCPNVYIHVTLLQPHANTLNDLPIRLYGIVPIKVDDQNTHLQPSIAMADEIRPGSKANITVKEMNGKKMTYTLAIVDEGLLDLTRFKTPDAWEVFYAKEALGVKTWDLYDHVIGAFAGRLDHMLSIGGDGSYDGSNTTKANRFKPMVKFAGPFTLEANKPATHQIDIPNYVGSIKVMVVAQNEGAYGKTEKAVSVKKPLMLLATLPRVLSPTETVSLPVDIFAMKENVKDVKVEVEANDLLQIEGSKQQNIHFNKTGDEVINFKIKVAHKTGIAKIKIKATCGSETAFQELELDIRTANPPMAITKEFELAANQNLTTDILFKNIEGTNSATIEISSSPSFNMEKRLGYLITYPHGCIEQTTSSAFPQLYLGRLQDLNDTQQTQVSNHVKRAIQRLKLFQTTSGGFSYWPGEQQASEYGSNYAGHFLLEAEKLGYAIPPYLKSQWIIYQTQQAKNWSADNGLYPRAESNELIQTYRLYTLALSGHPELGCMNKMREENNLSATASAALALAYQCIGQIETAKKLIPQMKMQLTNYHELSYSYGSALRDKSMILLAYSKIYGPLSNESMAKEIVSALNKETWMSTQETAYGLMSVCSYYGLNTTPQMNIMYQLNQSTAIQKQSKKMMLKISFSEKDIKNVASFNLKNNSASKLFVKVITKGAPLMGDTTVSNQHISLQCIYKNMKGELINPAFIRQGTDFYAIVTVKNTDRHGTFKEMCLNQLFPAGWEIHNSRLYDEADVSTVRYQDIRDDRVYSYFDLKENESMTVKLLLNATYLGRFYMPAVYSEAMYDNSIHANTKGTWVEVVK